MAAMPARTIPLILLVTLSAVSVLRAQPEPEVVLPEGREGLDPVVLELIEGLVEGVSVAPDLVGAWGRLCMAYEANLLWPEAAGCYRKASALDPGDASWRFQEAIARLEIGEVDEARRLLESVVVDAPDLLPARERLGYLLLEQGELEASLALFEGLIGRVPGQAAGYVGAGEVDLLMGHVERATDRLERAVALDPLASAGHYQLGLAYRANGLMEEAERELTLGSGGERRYLPSPLAREVATYSVHISAEIERAGTLLQAGRNAEATEVLEDLVRRSPENPTLLNDLAIAYMRQSRSSEARTLLDRALALDERDFSTYLNLSAWAGYSGRTSEAVEYARSAVEIAPGVAATHLALARALSDPRFRAASDDPAAARTEMFAELERAIELGVDTPDAYLQLARERWRDGEDDIAYEALDAALQRWPDFWPAELMRAWILVRSDRPTEAEEALSRVRELAPDHPDIATLEHLIAQSSAGGES